MNFKAHFLLNVHIGRWGEYLKIVQKLPTKTYLPDDIIKIICLVYSTLLFQTCEYILPSVTNRKVNVLLEKN